jgi:tetratricopeptide (TPR) repeat protein
VKIKIQESPQPKPASWERQFAAEAAYSDSVFRQALGDNEGCIAALKCSLQAMPTYAPAILSMGSVKYQLGRSAEGWELFQRLLKLPRKTTDLCQIIDEAGTFLTRIGAYEHGLALYRAAVKRFGDVAVLFEGLGYCAGHAGLLEEAVSAGQRAVALEPEKQAFVNNLGWSLLQAGRLAEARQTLERAVAMDPTDELAAENLEFCNQKIARGNLGKIGKPQAARRGSGTKH